MPRCPDLPCSSCGKPMWRGRGSRLDGTAKCQPCRAKTAEHGKPNTYKKRGCRCDLCRAAWAAYHAKYDRARKATLRGARAGGPISPADIYERDGWLCGICGLAVDPAEKFPSPGAATLDHITPVSLGGLHDADNLQCAHFYCNSVKGNRTEATAC